MKDDKVAGMSSEGASDQPRQLPFWDWSDHTTCGLANLKLGMDDDMGQWIRISESWRPQDPPVELNIKEISLNNEIRFFLLLILHSPVLSGATSHRLSTAMFQGLCNSENHDTNKSDLRLSEQ